MALVEVYGGQRSLAFELTTTIIINENTTNSVLGAMATMEDHIGRTRSHDLI